jgi:hypothetical protein
VPHRIKVLEDLLSKEECEYIISLMKKGKVSVFRESKGARILEESEEVNKVLRKYSDILTEAHRAEYGFYPQIYTTQAFVTAWIENGYAGLHMDNPRHGSDGFIQFSSIIYLNEDYEGGEIEFPNQKFKYKAKSGSAVIFPSAGTEMVHRINQVKNGTRYTMAFWHSSRKDRADRSLYPELF